MKLISNTVYQIQYLTISFTLDLQENIYTEVPRTNYMSAGEAGRNLGGFLDLFVNMFLEVQNHKYI